MFSEMLGNVVLYMEKAGTSKTLVIIYLCDIH